MTEQKVEAKKGRYEAVCLSNLIQNMDNSTGGSEKVKAALSSIDKKIVCAIERKGECYFILEK